MTNNVLNLRVTPNSTLIEFLEYDQRKKEMLVKYKRGKYKGMEKRYFDISKNGFMNILNSDSVGRSLIRLVQNKKSIFVRKPLLTRFRLFAAS
ncbi:MAG: hypothetical protein WBA74_27545 [Cyclobacteriaceae bacterium]